MLSTQGANLSRDAAMWLTPNVPNGGRSVSAELVASKGTTADGEKRTVGLESQTKYWATPRANDAEKRGNVAHRPEMPDLVGQSQAWPTPRGTDGTKGGPNQAGSKGDLMLPSAAAQWPTPNVCSPNSMRGHAQDPAKRRAQGHQVNLQDVAAYWPTPAARDSKGPNSEQHATVTGGGRKHMDQLANFVAHTPLDCLRPDPQTHDGPQSLPPNPGAHPPSTKRLNPYFTEWLMGWPAGWSSATELPASSAAEMASYRCRLRQRLAYLFAE